MIIFETQNIYIRVYTVGHYIIGNFGTYYDMSEY